MTVFQGNINDLMILLIDNSKYQKSSRQISWQLKCTFFCLFSWSILIPKFEIQNAARETVLRIEGPLCQCNMCGDVEFDVSNMLTRILFNILKQFHFHEHYVTLVVGDSIKRLRFAFLMCINNI